jgi:anthranilate phosphoribosyltransferase
VSVLDGGRVTERTIAPSDFGVTPIALDALRGGDAEQNASVLLKILEGDDHPAKTAVIVNAAAALHVARGADLAACAREAGEAIASGRAKATLAAWREAAQRAKATGGAAP